MVVITAVEKTYVENWKIPCNCRIFLSTAPMCRIPKKSTRSVGKILSMTFPQKRFPQSTDPVDKILTVKKPYRQELILAVISRILSCRWVSFSFKAFSILLMPCRAVE